MRGRGATLYPFIAALLLSVVIGCGAGPTVFVSDGEVLDETTFGDGVVPTETGVSVVLDCAGTEEPGSDIHSAIFEAINEYRVENGLDPLVYSSVLEQAADDHVRDLWEREFFDHINPDGEGPPDRALRAGFCHRYVGENIAAGQDTVERVMQAWKKSPSHNANLLEPRYHYVGVGYSVDATGRKYWGQNFAYKLP